MNTGTFSISPTSAPTPKNIIVNKKNWTSNISHSLFNDGHLTLFSNNFRKYELYESNEDLLALSVCWKRLRDGNIKLLGVTSLMNDELFTHIIQQDRDKANVIRDYYSKKIMMWKLKNVQLSSFRNDMNEFVHTDGKTFKEHMIKLAYRLPEFYEYDTEFETLARNYNHEVTCKEKIYEVTSKGLTFLKKFNISTNRKKVVEYWFSDASNNLVLLSFDPHNQLNSLLELTVKNSNVNVIGSFFKNKRDTVEYFKVSNYRFE
jgi:hypothetical protein